MPPDAREGSDPNSSIQSRKRCLRATQRANISQMPQEEKEAESAAIASHLQAWTVWQGSNSILAFLSMPDEPDISSSLTEAIRSGKSVYLPQYDSESNLYHPVRIRSMDSDLIPGRYGIPEPRPDLPRVSDPHLDLTLVPGLAFDRQGWRLGRGKGYYDRMLCMLRALRCGIAFGFQWMETVPHETLDQKMDWIITPSGAAKAEAAE